VKPKIHRIKVLIFLLLSFCLYSHAQQNIWDTTAIAVDLKKGAWAVKRSEEMVLEVSDVDKMKYHVHRVVTVLNEKGKLYSSFIEEADKFKSLDNIEIKVFDAGGSLIKKFKDKDISSQTGFLGFIDDYKIYILDLNTGSYPITIETEYTVKYKATFLFPTWQILRPNEAVEKSRFTARINKDIGLRFKEKNIHLNPTITQDGNYDVFEWSVSNLKPVLLEDQGPDYLSAFPVLLMAPNRFELDDKKGSMTSWKDFGKWYAELSSGQDNLTPVQVAFYRELVINAPDDRAKEMIIYNYLKKNFRYVSIQLGIGGLKPASAEITDEKKFGDCKALSTYMMAVLKVVNVKSYVALVNAGPSAEPVDEDFPCNRFNHMILCIPGEIDTTWLECTSRLSEFGILGNFTENRNALLIVGNAGVLVHTPRSRATENIFKSYSTVALQEDGSGKTQTIFSVSGEYKQDWLQMKEAKPDMQRAYLNSVMGFKNPAEPVFTDNQQDKNLRVVVDQNLSKIPELNTGSKMFLRPYVSILWSVKMPKDQNRHQDYFFSCPLMKSDSTVISLPKGYVVDDLPFPMNDSCKYAHFTCKSWYDSKHNAVITYSHLVLNTHKIPASDYTAVKKFFDGVLETHDERIVIRKN
jgi:hypothetical protein